MSLQAAFINTTDLGDWRDVPHRQVGTIPGQLPEVLVSVGISAEAELLWRIDLCVGVGYSCFQDVRCVGEQVYVGYGAQVTVLQARSGQLSSYSLDGYFGHLYTAFDLEASESGLSVLVASASELLRFAKDGSLMWSSSNLGIDGVVVRQIQDGVIIGDGEWDPPGGWKPFHLEQNSGAVRPT